MALLLCALISSGVSGIVCGLFTRNANISLSVSFGVLALAMVLFKLRSKASVGASKMISRSQSTTLSQV